MADRYFFTQILLIRHAQARTLDDTYGPDTPLSALGLRQAELLASAFVGARSISAIYCSPFQRAIQTAEPLAAALKMRPVIDPGIAEFQVETAPIEKLKSSRADVLLWRPDQRGTKDGETIEEFFTRVSAFCVKACDAHRNETIVFLTHAGTIDAIFRWAVAIPPSQPWMFEVESGNASISEIEAWPHGRIDGGPPMHAVLHRIGDGKHLGALESRI